MDANAPQSVAELRNHVVALARRLKQSARVDNETWMGLMALGAIHRGEGQVTPTQIASELKLRSSNMAQILAGLDQRGLIARSPDPADKRRVRLSLTEAGSTLVRETRARRDEWLSQAMEGCLSPQEQLQLIEAGELMRRIALSSPRNPTSTE